MGKPILIDLTRLMAQVWSRWSIRARTVLTKSRLGEAGLGKGIAGDSLGVARGVLLVVREELLFKDGVLI